MDEFITHLKSAHIHERFWTERDETQVPEAYKHNS